MILLLVGWLGCAHRSDAIDLTRGAAPWGQGFETRLAELILEAGAADSDVAVRARALEALVLHDPAPAGGPWGPRGRFDPSEFVQRAVIRALSARVGDVAAIGLLRELALDRRVEPTTRGLALAAFLGASGDAAAVLAALASEPEGPGSFGVLAAAARTGDAGVLARLDRLLRTEDVPLDLPFWTLLGDSGRAEVADPLEVALARMEPLARVPALVALFRVAPARATGRVVELLTGPDLEGAIEAIELLASVPDAKVEPLLGMAGPAVRNVASLAVVGRTGAPLGLLSRGLDAEDREERVAAVSACHQLLRRGVPLPGPVRARLQALLVDEDPGLQMRAALALASSPGPDLDVLLNDESLLLRVIAASRKSGDGVDPVRPGR